MSLETKIGEWIVNNPLKKKLLTHNSTDKHFYGEWIKYVARFNKKEFLVDLDGKVVFGGLHYRVNAINYICDVPFMWGIHKDGDRKFCFYDKNGKSYSSEVEFGLSQIKEEASPLIEWGLFYNSFNMVYNHIEVDGHHDKTDFLEGVIKLVKGYFQENEGDVSLLQNKLKQLVLGFEYLASHPDNALGFIEGGKKP